MRWAHFWYWCQVLTSSAYDCLASTASAISRRAALQLCACGEHPNGPQVHIRTVGSYTVDGLIHVSAAGPGALEDRG